MVVGRNSVLQELDVCGAGLFVPFALVSCHHKDMQIAHYPKLTHQDQELMQERLTIMPGSDAGTILCRVRASGHNDPLLASLYRQTENCRLVSNILQKPTADFVEASCSFTPSHPLP